MYWLVVEPYPSEKYGFVNWDDDIPNIWKNKKIFQTTNQYMYICILLYINMDQWTSWLDQFLDHPTCGAHTIASAVRCVCQNSSNSNWAPAVEQGVPTSNGGVATQCYPPVI